MLGFSNSPLLLLRWPWRHVDNIEEKSCIKTNPFGLYLTI